MGHFAFVLPNLVGGGAERVALSLIAEFLERGHSIDLVLARREGDLLSLIPSGVKVVDLKARRLRNAVLPLARYLRQVRPDAVQVSMWPLTVLAVIANKLAGGRARVVVSDHGILSEQYRGSPVTLAALRNSVRRIYPSASAAVAVSEGMAADMAKLSGLDRDAFAVIYNPVVAPSSFPAVPPEIEALWTGGEHRIITAGNLKRVKNHELLIRAFAKMDNQSARLMILGEGELRPRLEQLARQLGVADRIVMPGFVTDPWPYYASANLFALSSDNEGLSLVIIEALLIGLSVVSTDCPHGPGEILKGGHGELVPCGDMDALASAMSAVLRKPANPEVQRRRGADFNIRNAADAYEKLMSPTV